MADNKKHKPNKIIDAEDSQPIYENENEKLEIHFQQVFYKDLSSSLPSLFEQLQAKDRQIEELNKTINKLLNKNDNLENKLLVPQTKALSEGVIGDDSPFSEEQKKTNEGLIFGPKPLLILLGLLIFLVLSLKAFDYFAAPSYQDSWAFLSEYQKQQYNHHELIAGYESKLELLTQEKGKKQQEIDQMTGTIDTLSRSIAVLSLQLGKEEQRSETIDVLSKQLEQKDAELLAMNTVVDSLESVVKQSRIAITKLEDGNKLLRAINDLKQENTAAQNQQMPRMMYILMLILTVAVGFVIFDRNRT
jgi:chromosome segregation ATPase